MPLPSCTARGSTPRPPRCSRRSRRVSTGRRVAEAIVALELLFDYLDGLRRASRQPTRFATASACSPPFTAVAVRLHRPRAPSRSRAERRRLSRRALACRLSRLAQDCPLLTPSPERAADRCAARGRSADPHACCPRLGIAQVEEWATTELGKATGARVAGVRRCLRVLGARPARADRRRHRSLHLRR